MTSLAPIRAQDRYGTERLLRGIRIWISQAYDGRWHWYISGGGLSERELKDAGATGIMYNSHGGHWWASGGRTAHEHEARGRACRIVGLVFADRLRQAMEPKEVPAEVIPGMREVTL